MSSCAGRIAPPYTGLPAPLCVCGRGGVQAALIEEVRTENAELRTDNAGLRTAFAELLARVDAIETTDDCCQGTAEPAVEYTTLSPAAEQVTPAPTGSPTAAPIGVSTASPHVLDVAANVGIYNCQYQETFGIQLDIYVRLTTVIGYVQISTNGGARTLDGGFRALRGIGGGLDISSNRELTSTGDSFSALREIGGPLRIHTNARLTSLGTALRSLERVVGVLAFYDNPQLSDFESLRNLSCHGGVTQNNRSTYCHNCPSWLVDKPRC